MEPTVIIFPVIALSVMGLLFGIGLSIAGKLFSVSENPLISEVLEKLPGVNCGACGFPGCAGYASAIVEHGASLTACPVGGSQTAKNISEIMGTTAGEMVHKIAFIKCGGTKEKTSVKYDYKGYEDCASIHQMPNLGPKDCTYGCVGGGSCLRVCEFGAIEIIDGVSTVNEEKCTACGLCVKTCPKRLIELIPKASTFRVKCNSWDKGKFVRNSCSVGCIGCKICQKNCEFDAIEITTELAKINYDKCTLCGVCTQKCPMKTITNI